MFPPTARRPPVGVTPVAPRRYGWRGARQRETTRLIIGQFPKPNELGGPPRPRPSGPLAEINPRAYT